MAKNLIQMTMNLVYAIGQDAGNASMRKAGRVKWSAKDYNVAAETFRRLAPDAIDCPPAFRKAIELGIA